MYNEGRSGPSAKKVIYAFFLIFFVVICIFFGVAIFRSLQKVSTAKDSFCDSGADPALFGLPKDACEK